MSLHIFCSSIFYRDVTMQHHNTTYDDIEDADKHCFITLF